MTAEKTAILQIICRRDARNVRYYSQDTMCLFANCVVYSCVLRCIRVNGVGRFRCRTISVHIFRYIQFRYIKCQYLSVRTKYLYSPLRYINVNFDTRMFGTKTLFLDKLKLLCMLFECRI